MAFAQTFMDLTPADPELPAALELLRQLRTHRTIDELAELYRMGYESGYRFTVLVEDGVVRAFAGHRVLINAAYGRYLYVDDLVTREGARSRGYGAAMLAHLHELKATLGCEDLQLDSGNHRRRAHSFYRAQGLVATGLHFGMPPSGG